jgi:DNA-binding response OmpR family regulator
MGKRVLVADDSATIQKAFSMVLGGLQDTISLVPARSYDEALSAARQSRPDLIIADIGLGNRSGYDLCVAIKNEASLRGVPVYILGSGQIPYDDARGRQAGADGHLIKPFESQSLIDRIHEALSRPASTPVAAARPESLSPPVAASRPATRPPVVASAAAPDLDDDYGEFTIERSSGGTALPSAAAPPQAPARSMSSASTAMPVRPAAQAPASPFAPAPSTQPGVTTGSGAALRPSLIPGARPAAPRSPISVASASVAPPAPVASRPVGPPALPKRTEVIADPAFHPKRPEPLAEAGVGAGGAGHPGIGRTIMGLPAVAIPGAPLGSPREARPVPPAIVPAMAHTAVPNIAPAPAPIAPARPQPAPPVAAPASPAAAQPAPAARPASPPVAAVASLETAAAVSARIDQKVAAIAARGPEYEALAKLSREIIEQVVWEVVPELAEAIIREHVERLARK